MTRNPLGQHYLIDTQVRDKIIDAAAICLEDIVVEIGPGKGALTSELLKRAGRVITVEIDASLGRRLASKLGNPPNLDVIVGDARTLDLDDLLGPYQKYKMVSNMPFYAANPIVRRFLEQRNKPDLMVVTVQKEVALAMAALPGKMNLLSVAIQVYGSPGIVCTVPPQAFKPSPKVDSAVVRIELFSSPAVKTEDMTGFFNLVRKGFASPRKQIRNSLAIGLAVRPDEVDDIFRGFDFDMKRRPSTLSLDEWEWLYDVYCRE